MSLEQVLLIQSFIVNSMLTGGQPADTGTIKMPDGSVVFKVHHVQKPKDCTYIQHLGAYETDKRYIARLRASYRIYSG